MGRGDFAKAEKKKPKKGSEKVQRTGMMDAPPPVEVMRTKGKKDKQW